MKSYDSGIASLVLVLLAASSLLTMILVTKIDTLIHQDLYRFGLQFSPQWALPYWTLSVSLFGIGWFNIIVAIFLELYLFAQGRKKVRLTPIRREDLKSKIQGKQQLVEEKRAETSAKPIEGTLTHEIKPAENAEAEKKESPASPTVVEPKTQNEGEEAKKPIEAAQGVQTPMGAASPHEQIETTQPEVKEGTEQKAPIENQVPESKPKEESKETQETAEVSSQHEPSSAVEGQIEQEPKAAEATQTETEESATLSTETQPTAEQKSKDKET